MKKRSRRRRKNIFVPIVVLIFCCVFTAMVAYGWQSRKKNVKVADSSKNANETVEVNQKEQLYVVTAGNVSNIKVFI